MDEIANWLWQGCVVAATASALFGASRRVSASTRYQLWWVTLAVVLSLPLMFFGGTAPAPDAVTGASMPTLPSTPTGWRMPVLPVLPAWLAALAIGLWTAWAIVSTTRTILAMRALSRVRRGATAFPADLERQLRAWQSVKKQGREAHLLVSSDVRAAAVLGLTSPAIVVSPALFETLTIGEIDQIVIHEWAHVQRRDDIARLAQRLVRALFGLHPAVWWIDRQLHLERETACDDWAVLATGSATGLATSLTKLAALSHREPGALLMPAAVRRPDLSARVLRLLDTRRNRRTSLRPGALATAATGLVVLGVMVASADLIVMANQPPAQPTATMTVASRMLAPTVKPSSDMSARQPEVVRPGRTSPARSQGQPNLVPAIRDVAQETGAAEALASPRIPEYSLAASDGLEQLPGGAQTLSASDAPDPQPGPVAAATETPGSSQATTPWQIAADTAVNVGKGSQKAATKTAGFFSRLGRSVAASF